MRFDTNKMRCDANKMDFDGNKMQFDGNGMRFDGNGMRSDTDKMDFDEHKMQSDRYKMHFDTNQMDFDEAKMQSSASIINRRLNGAQIRQRRILRFEEPSNSFDGLETVHRHPLKWTPQSVSKPRIPPSRDNPRHESTNIRIPTPRLRRNPRSQGVCGLFAWRCSSRCTLHVFQRREMVYAKFPGIVESPTSIAYISSNNRDLLG